MFKLKNKKIIFHYALLSGGLHVVLILKDMWIIPTRTIPVSENRESCLGPVFRPFMNLINIVFRYSD